MPVVGAGVFPRMFMAAKSVCVSSLLGGPRSLLFGALDTYAVGEELWKPLNWVDDVFVAGDAGLMCFAVVLMLCRGALLTSD